MICLTGYIGIRGEHTSPASGLFINSLPGITLDSMEKIATLDQEDFDGVWADVQEEAAARFEMDFISEVTKCYKLNAYCDYEGLICNNKAKLKKAWHYLLGNQLMLYRLYSNRLNRYTTVDLETAGKLKDFYQVEYESALKQAVQLIDISDCDCSDCGGNPEYVTFLP